MGEFADFELDLDLSDEKLKPWDGEQAPLVDAGDYHLKIVGFESKAAKKSGNPMIAVTFEVEDEGPFRGQKVFNNYSLSEKAIGRLKALGIAVGAQLGKVIASEYFGQTIKGSVVHTQSAGDVDPDGNAREGRVFANVVNEQPVAAAAAPEKAKPVTPPAAKGAATTTAKAPAAGAARRA